MGYIDKFSDWQAPSLFDKGTNRMGWISEQVEEAENWLKSQQAYLDIPEAMDIISGRIEKGANTKRSDLTTNHAKYAIRKIIGTLSDVREVGYFTSDAQFYLGEADMLNKAAKAISLKAQFTRKLRMALQYMAITGSGYLWPRFIKTNLRDKGNVEFEPLGLCDVLPTQLPPDNDIQGAYAVTLIRFMPVWQAHARFPQYQAQLLPIARRRYKSSVSHARMDLASRFKYGTQTDAFTNLYCEIRYTFIHDLSINTTGSVLPMGEDEGASWYYEVPYLGQQIKDSVTSDGIVTTRAATLEDCMIYPNLRLMISCKGMRNPMWDGPAFDWHGQVPVARYCADDWVQEPCGFSLTHDIASSQRAIQRTERGVDQVVKARLDPALGFDRSAGLNDKTAGELDPFQERIRVGVDGEPGKVLQPLLPPWLLDVPAFVGEWVKYCTDRGIDAQLGLNEMTNLAEMKMNMNSEGAERALAEVGPLVKDIASGMESSTARVWEMLKYLIIQYYNTRRLMEFVGPDGITKQTLDFNPDTLVPSHAPDEILLHATADLSEVPVVPWESKYTDAERAKIFADTLTLTVIPHTQHSITQTSEQLKWLQLWRGGAPIAFCDIAKKLNIENFGMLEGSTLWERYISEQKQKIELQAQAALLMQSLGLGPPAPPPPTQQPGTGEGGGQKGTGGRPPSGHSAPKIVQKGANSVSGPRTTITES